MIQTAVVILNWNGLGFFKQFFKTLISETEDENTAVYIIDNASTDKSIHFIEQNYAHVPIIKLDKNYGFAGGYNKGLEKIDARYYILLNSDIEVTPDWTTSLISTLKNNPHIAACAPKIKAYNNKDYFEYAGAAGGFIDKYGYPFCNGRLFNYTEQDNGQYELQKDIFWATGAAMCIRSSAFHEIEGFDDDFFAHMEEIDVCWRLKNRGYSIQYVPSSTVYHVGGGTLPKENPFKTYLNFRNNLFLLYKNLDTSSFYSILFRRHVFDLLACIMFLINGKFKNTLAVCKGYKQFYQSLSSLKAKRKKSEAYRTQRKHKEIFQKSIIIQHYLFKKKHIHV
ncbi:MAG: glycosyltransferase family 2 protein [Bacteroidales bacterium]